MADNGESLTHRIKTPARAKTPLEIWTFGQMRGLFRSEQPAFEGRPATASPDAPIDPGTGTWFFRDNGAGKSQFCVRFPSGAVQVLATEP